MNAPTLLDWTEGGDGITYQRCGHCAHVWYFRREFCPSCGKASPPRQQSTGTGVLHALTRVFRAPSEALRVHAPYSIGLVDLDEGVRVMAHVRDDARIGDRVRAEFVTFGDRRIPSFCKE